MFPGKQVHGIPTREGTALLGVNMLGGTWHQVANSVDNVEDALGRTDVDTLYAGQRRADGE